MGADNDNIEDNINHTGVPEFEDIVIGYEKSCQGCGKDIIIYATHEVPLCAECAIKSCPIARKKIKDE